MSFALGFYFDICLYFFISVTRQLGWNLNPFNLNCRCSSFEKMHMKRIDLGILDQYWIWTQTTFISWSKWKKVHIGSGSLPCILLTSTRSGITIFSLLLLLLFINCLPLLSFSSLGWSHQGCTVCNMLVACTLSLLIHLKFKLLNTYLTKKNVYTLHQLSMYLGWSPHQDQAELCCMLVTCTLSLLIFTSDSNYWTHILQKPISTLVDPPTRIRLNSVW